MVDRGEAPPADDVALETMLRDRRFGPADPDESTPWDFVLRWPDAVLRQRVWPLCSRLLVDGDPLVRLRAIEFARDWSDGAAITTPRLIEAAEQHPELYGDEVVEGAPLRDAMAHALANRALWSDGTRIAAILRKMAADRPLGGGAASVLGRHDPAFVAAQGRRWGDGAIDWLEQATRSLALYRRDEIVGFLQALAGLSAPSRERLLAAVESAIKRDDQQAAAVAKGQRLPAPSRPAPSAAECRQAIGLP